MTRPDNKHNYTRLFWAKARPYRRQGPERIHLLEHHLADVGACFEALLSQPTIRQRLACSGGLNVIDEATASRLSLFAALHDIGKVNVGFQTQVWRDSDLPSGRRPAWFRGVGHTLDLAPVLRGDDNATADWFYEALGWWWEAIESWDSRGGETVCGLFVAALSHHGQPLHLNASLGRNTAIWSAYGDLQPAKYIERIGRLSRIWFPAAFSSDASQLPPSSAFQHTFLGLCTLADWIGSNEKWFPFCAEPSNNYMKAARQGAKRAMKDIGLDISHQRSVMSQGTLAFSQTFGFEANAIQQAAVDAVAVGERLVIIESETGSGKTEAALWRFAKMYAAELVDGLYFALPTRSAATQFHVRVKKFIANLMIPSAHRPPVVLAVPGYDTDVDARRVAMGYDSGAAGQHEDARPWASENPKRYLAAQIAVGTVDQAMMSALKVKHAHLRGACLSRNLLVVDEVHASNTYMRRIIKALLDAHLGAGGYALLMSATLGSVARQDWLSPTRPGPKDILPLAEAIKSPYPAVSHKSQGSEEIMPVAENGCQKAVSMQAIPSMHTPDDVAKRALKASRDGARVLIIRNTVAYAMDTQQALQLASLDANGPLLFSCRGIPTLHHGRFAAGDRRLLDRAVEGRLGKDRLASAAGVIVVGTQTLEQSLDIDADLLITDLCPVDVLLQRIGRLHRHRSSDSKRPAGHSDPVCIVLTPGDGDLSPLLKRGANRNGLGPHGYVYEDLRTVEATRRLLNEFPTWRIPSMNRLLVERATHPAALEAIVEELGEDWLSHAIELEGGAIAENLTAAQVIIPRERDFLLDNDDIQFGADEEHIRTRLGDDRIDVYFHPLPASPFSKSLKIEKLPISVRWLEGVEVPDSVTHKPMEEGGFSFSIGNLAFRYNRLGLRREG